MRPRTTRPRAGRGKSYTVLSWSPKVTAASGKNYTINGYLNDKNIVERVETWLGDNIMGDMHILAIYSGWKDIGGAHGAGEDRADARRLAVLRSRGHGREGESDRSRDAGARPRRAAGGAAPAAAPASRGCRPRRCPGGAARRPRPRLTVTNEKLGDGLYRLTTGAGSYDSLIVEFRDHIMMLEAGQTEARARSPTSPRRRS